MIFNGRIVLRKASEEDFKNSSPNDYEVGEMIFLEDVGKFVVKKIDNEFVYIDPANIAEKSYVDNLIENTRSEIPKNTSQLTNDKEYICGIATRGADFTTPVFLKMQKEGEILAFYAAQAFSETPSDSATYTSNHINELLKSNQEETNALISAIPKFSIVVAEALPTEDISSTAVYLISSGDEEPNLYTEYIYVNDKWEKLGEQSVDLTGYVRNADLKTLENEKQDKLKAGTGIEILDDGTINCTFEDYSEVRF